MEARLIIAELRWSASCLMFWTRLRHDPASGCLGQYAYIAGGVFDTNGTAVTKVVYTSKPSGAIARCCRSLACNRMHLYSVPPNSERLLCVFKEEVALQLPSSPPYLQPRRSSVSPHELQRVSQRLESRVSRRRRPRPDQQAQALCKLT